MLYLARHGQTEFNVQRRLQGSMDSPLTRHGIDQATRVGRTLRLLIGDAPGWRIVSSPQPRARATAEIFRAETGLGPVATDARLAEISVGSWEGLTLDEIDRGWPGANSVASVRRAWVGHCPDGERFEAVRDRLSSWLAEMRDERIVAVSHGVAGSILRGLYAGLSHEAMLDLLAPNDTLFVLENGAFRGIDCSDGEDWS
ncbi:MAG: histidine phosphatase family protein [Sphingomonas sp.]